MKLNLTEITDHRAQYQANMRRLAALDRLLAALKAHQAHPCNIHWREVLEVLAEIPNPPLTLEVNNERV